MKDEDKQALLFEYQAAQDSAQHHDSLLWNITGIIWGAELVLLGFIIQSIESFRSKPVVLISSFLAIVLIIFLFVTFLYLRNIRNFKYARCKEIEVILGLKQHRLLPHPKFIGTIMFYSVLLIFIVTWVIVIITYLI
jgi:heme/copper-type cytochrome/quinol oxidase subunit 4